MPTTVPKSIGTGGDYSTLQAWEDACPANLVTADQVWQGQLKNQAFTTSSGSLLTVLGTTTDATRYLELTTEAGASFRDNASVQSNALRYNTSNGAACGSTATYSTMFSISVDFCRFSKLQVQSTAANTLTLVSNVTGAATLDINGCIFEGASTAVTDIYGANAKIRNSLIVQRNSGRTCIAKMKNLSQAINCTFVVPSDKTAATNAFNGQYSAATIKNCAIFNASGYNTLGTTPTFTTCYSDISSPPSGVTAATYNTALFVNITDATRDYRIPSGSSLIDNGTTDSTNAANDIAGTARPSGSAYDVGCWEYVAAGASFQSAWAVNANSLASSGAR